MHSTSAFIAQDVKSRVEFNPSLVRAYRLLGYENRATADVDFTNDDFTNDQVDAGEIGAEHQATAVYDVVLSGEGIPNPQGAPTIEDGEASDVELDVTGDELAA